MSELVSGDGRTHINSRLMRESLQNRGVLSQTDSDHDLQVFPDVTLVSIGGQSIFDRGKDAILPLSQYVAYLEVGREEGAIPFGVPGRESDLWRVYEPISAGERRFVMNLARSMHPDERIFTFWDYFRKHWETKRNALSPGRLTRR